MLNFEEYKQLIENLVELIPKDSEKSEEAIKAVKYSISNFDRSYTSYNSFKLMTSDIAPEGITIFGQKTAQRLTTALDRINVRRLMIFLNMCLFF